MNIKFFKICLKCKINQSLENFSNNKNFSYGKQKYCKKCKYQFDKEYRKTDKYKIYQLKYRKNNKEKNKIYQKNYKENNPNTEYFKFYMKNRRKNDFLFNLVDCLRSRLTTALRVKHWKKDTHFAEYIGCTREELINYISSKFIEGMSWDNHSKFGWHIDHITPLSSAKTKEELYKLCHYTNLQPLWWIDNIRKNNKI